MKPCLKFSRRSKSGKPWLMHVFFLLIPLVHCAGTIHGQSLMIECDTLRIQSNLNSPWNIEPLTENQLLLTERAGTVWKVD
ncbi:MAG: hypothetical protein ACPG08_05080, partial [Flavobacteriales bacterium]